MLIFKKGNKMTENREEPQSCCCECCHCKKIFMAMVVILLAFIAGIMVGNCRQQSFANKPYQITPHIVQHKIYHRGKKQSSNTAQPNPTSAATDTELGGYVIEVEQAN